MRRPDVAPRAPFPLTAGLAVAVAVLLTAGLGSLVAMVGEDGRARSRSGADGPDPAVRTELEALVPQLQRFVERVRGLTFKEPVQVSLLDDAAFRRRLVAGEDEGGADDVGTAEDVLRAFGLLDDDDDLAGSVGSLLGDSVTGFYDSATDELVVRGEEPTPEVRVTLVHELTHALQDQHFELDRPALDERDDEAPDAFVALVEGDAVRVEEAYFDSLRPAEQRQVAAEESSVAVDPDVPEVLFQLIGFPYEAGPGFVAAVLDAGGQPALDRAFSSPPETSEQVLHPEVYLAGGRPAQVSPPPAGGRVVDEGVLGELGLRLVLSQELSRRDAIDASRGWGADRYVAWRRGADTCVRTAVVMDDAEASARLRTALGRWAGRRRGASVEPVVEPGSATVVTACG